MSKTTLVKVVPKLEIAKDDEVADHLRHLLKDADDGFRRVVKVGLYIEWIAANLARGQLMPWLEAHCPDVSQRTIYNWRSLAKNLCEWSGLKFASLANLPMAGDQLLELPPEKLPPQLRESRQKMEEALSASKTAKQLFLFLGFKQGEIDESTGYPKAKIGRRKNEGGRKPSLTGTIEEIAAARKTATWRHLCKAADEMEKAGTDFIALDDQQNTRLLAAFERTAKSIRKWLDTPAAKRDGKELQKFWKTL